MVFCYNADMETNGRSVYRITTTDPQRQALWNRLFGLSALPVRSPYPVEMVAADGGAGWFYELDNDAMQPWQLYRLAGYISARCWGVSHEAALDQVQGGWFISANDCKLAEADTARPAFSFSSRTLSFSLAGS
jgi:hypothetical protein